MKQQQAGIIEAKAAIRRADETVIQGRSIVVFTVVTIFFVSRPCHVDMCNPINQSPVAAFFLRHCVWYERPGTRQRDNEHGDTVHVDV